MFESVFELEIDIFRPENCFRRAELNRLSRLVVLES
jgi:hypothetical protein